MKTALLIPAALGIALYKTLTAATNRMFDTAAKAQAATRAELAATRASSSPDAYLRWLENEWREPYDVEKDGL